MAKKFSFDDYWAQQIFKVRSANQDFIWALVRREYGPGDIERKGIGLQIGTAEEEIYEMETDNDPESETYTKRVPRKRIVFKGDGTQINEPLPIEIRLKFTHKFTPENISKYKKLVGYNSVFGATQFYTVINGSKFTVDDVDEFWGLTVRESKIKYKPKTKAKYAKEQLQ